MEENDITEEDETTEEKKEEVLDPNNPDHYYLIVERDFNKTMLEIEDNPEALQYIEPFNKLFEHFFKTFAKQQECETRVLAVGRDLADKDNKIELLMRLAEEDERTIGDLKNQIQNAWHLADAAHSREQQAIEVIDNLRRQVEKLNAELDFKNKMAFDDGEGAAKTQDDLEREREKLINEVTQLTTKLQNAIGYQEELERKNSEVDLKMKALSQQLTEQIMETKNEKKLKENLEGENENLMYKLEQKEAQINELHKAITDRREQIHYLEKDMKDLRASHEKLSRNLDYSLNKLTKLTDEFNNLKYDADVMKLQLTEKTVGNKALKDEMTKVKSDLQKCAKVRDSLEKKYIKLVREKEELIVERTDLRHRIYLFVKEIDDFKKYIVDDKKKIDIMTKEKDMLNKSYTRQQTAFKDQQRFLQLQEQAKKKMELELDLFLIESGKHKKLIARLERERDRLSEEQLDLTNTIQDQIDDIRMKKANIFDLRKEVTERDAKLRQQQNLYEAIRSVRNALQKSLQESTSECTELKRKLKLLSIQAEQLKENISEKDKQLIKMETIMRMSNKEKEQLKSDLLNKGEMIKTLKLDLSDLTNESKKLRSNIAFLKNSLKQHGQHVAQLMNERDVLGAQLVRRNDEIFLLNDKITILQLTLARGEAHYDLRLDDIRLLKMEIKRLRQEKTNISKTMASMMDLRQEIFHLERDLTKSRLKCKALEQEMQNPLNIHRWRKLAGSDPSVLDLLHKIQILQRRLLHQGSIAVERERQLKQSEKLYLNLRKVMAQQAGPALQEELASKQRALKQRGYKLKSLVSELNMSDMKINEYKSDIQKLTEELNEMKKKFLAEHRALQALRATCQQGRELSSNDLNDLGGSEAKFAGGGFRMSVSKIASKSKQ
ncbi:unnamed protein product [Phyllotreta striolata]|uniref:Cilia- and flagella-associated protein 58 central coiled coil domain-containing protein n=1 Tax=Phyllotreta striolata TaxID=444603 RepID=A0A9P0E0K6_PHYSR|nr:unnamed protein product [Phyllotreta striolata]